VLAGTAEQGLQMAADELPDLILLDHQLPGTTGFEVCRQLHENPQLMRIPVVVSSTLRKRAYAEYTDWANVVDMLPKPYTAELLITTVANSLDTGALIVNSQAQGSAVPEVISDPGEADLSGSFSTIRLRELLDFLNNGNKRGLLEVEGDRFRIAIYLTGGRIQAVCAQGIDSQQLVQKLPEALHSLAPVLNLTVAGRSCSQVDSLVELLDRKVLDPRLLQKMLRYQAATLVFRGFSQEQNLRQFRFYCDRSAPALHSKLPVDVSTLALLIDAVTLCDESELPRDLKQRVFSRRASRGQNLDRTGVAAQHGKLLSQLGEPSTIDQLAARASMSAEETQRVLYAMQLAELVDARLQDQGQQLLAIEADPSGAQQLRSMLEHSTEITGRVIRDRLALQLVLHRMTPSVIAVALDNPECRALALELQQSNNFPNAKWVGIQGHSERGLSETDLLLDQIVTRPFTAQHMKQAIDDLFVATASHSR
jgi:CheY-like chemotaxis protein